MLLGVGRAIKDAQIDLSVGLVLRKKVGDKVAIGESLVTIHANRQNLDDILEHIYEHMHIGAQLVVAPKLIEEIIID